MPSKEHTTKEPRRANRPTLIFDADFWLSPDFQYFKSKAGADGFTYLIALLGIARRSADYKLTVTPNRIIGYAAMLGIDGERVKEIIDIGVDATLLAKDGDQVWSPYQMRNVLAYVQKCETLRENGRQKANAKHLLTICEANHERERERETETEREREREDLKGGSEGGGAKPQTYSEMLAKQLKKGIAAVFDIPPELETALYTWAAYRKESSKPITERSIKQLVKTYRGRAAELQRDVEHSITQGYQGLFAPNGNNSRKSNFDRNMEILNAD
jgi:hypothetical protein